VNSNRLLLCKVLPAELDVVTPLATILLHITAVQISGLTERLIPERAAQ